MLVQKVRKVGVIGGKVQTEISIVTKPRMAVPELTLQIRGPVGSPQ